MSGFQFEDGPVRRQFISHFERLSSEITLLVSNLTMAGGRLAPDAYVTIAKLEEAVSKLRAFSKWLGQDFRTLPKDQRRVALAGALAGYRDAGFSDEQALENLEAAQVRSKGRSATKRHVAIPALDMWLTNRRLSWPRVFRRVCPCGKDTHDAACLEQIRQQVNDLRSFMRKNGLTEPRRCQPGEK